MAVHEVLAMIRNVLLVVALIPTVLFLLAVLVAKLRDAFEPRWVTVAVAALDEPMLFESQIDIDGKHLGYYLLTYHTVGGRLTHRYTGCGFGADGRAEVQIRAGQGQGVPTYYHPGVGHRHIDYLELGAR